MRDLSLAWRNIWRNKRRTLITVASIFFGVFISTMMTSMQNGMYIKMIDNVVRFYSGYIQIHHPKYWESKSIDHLFAPSDAAGTKIASTPNVQMVVPRLESFALMSFGTQTKGAMVIGINPEKENELTQLKQWVKDGRYLSGEDDGILLAINLAKNLNIQLGDTLALISQGYHGISASALFPVVGILEFPTPAMNNFGTYISLTKAQEFFSAPNMLTSLALMVNNYEQVQTVKTNLANSIGDKYSVLTWDEMDPVTQQMINSGKGKGLIVKGILYILIGFGIFSTIIMMIAERRKELGVMVAVGMPKLRLAKVLFYETVLIGLVGLFAGFSISLPFIYMLAQNPIPISGPAAETYESMGMEAAIFFSTQWGVFTDQLLIILCITLFVGLYPLQKIMRLKVTQALHT